MRSLRLRTLAAIVAGIVSFSAAPSAAQAWHYAAFQPAAVTSNEADLIISGFGDYGTSFVGQYRFMIEKRTELWADIGLASVKGYTPFLIGVAGAWNFLTPSKDRPIDLSATLGVYGAFDKVADLIRIPVGLNVGHTWKLSNGHDLSGFAFPRVSFDICSSHCSGTNTNLNFDLGARYDITSAMVGMAAFTVGAVGEGSSQGGFGVALALKTK